MNFAEALSQLQAGKHMRCKYWPDKTFRVYLDDDNLLYIRQQECLHSLTGFDLTATDWEEYKPNEELS